ncbi:MAG TPA: DMT family transporter [Kineosporiaceae bacterium]|nr:DMT family transporter [Kineosporiaceae bacterium]
MAERLVNLVGALAFGLTDRVGHEAERAPGRPGRPMNSVAVRSRLPLLALVAATACWGSVVVTVKIAARGLGVVALTTIELTASALVLATMVATSSVARRRLPPRPSAAVLFAAVLEPGVTYLLINAGIALTSGTHSAVLIGLESAVVVLMSAVVTRCMPPRAVLLGLAVAVLGAALLTEGAGGRASLIGDLLVLAGILTAAGYVVVASGLAGRMDALHLTGYQFVVGWLVTTPLFLVVLSRDGVGPGHPDAVSVAAAIATGVVGSVVAFLLYNWALASVSPALAGTSLTLIPVFGLAMSSPSSGTGSPCARWSRLSRSWRAWSSPDERRPA